MKHAPARIVLGILLVGIRVFADDVGSSVVATLAPEPDEELSGGATTVFQNGQNAFSLPLANISRENRREHVVGNSFFNKNWVIAPASTSARDGLGPLFHARSCSGCHTRDGRGAPPEPGEMMTGLLFRLSVPGAGPHGEPLPDPSFGGQLSVRGIPGVEPEGDVTITYEDVPGIFADGSPYQLRRPLYQIVPSSAYPAPSETLLTSPRVAAPVHGLGLLEAVPEATILALADPDDTDADDISGRPNYVWNPEAQVRQLGRFGWKANQPDLRQQTAVAFVADIGITSSIHPQEDITAVQVASLIPFAADPAEPELDEKLLKRTVRYQQTIAPPARRDWTEPTVLQGKELFTQARCAACHVPVMETAAEFPEVPELAGQTIRPYTDLLLHDMGPDLADGRPDFEADGSEWRTPPLWGIGLTEAVSRHTYFLHDGRARNLEEAILWHGGEAEFAREAYRQMALEDREAMLAFLRSL